MRKPRLAMVLLVATFACGEDGSDATGPDYEREIQPIWDDNCLCHRRDPEGMMEADYMTLDQGVSHGELVGTAAMGGAGLIRVVPGDLEASYLWHKLHGTQLDVGGSGDPMPPYGPPIGPLPDETLALIGAWIEAGAKP